MGGNRPRRTNELIGEIVKDDPLAFTKNRCSDNARMVLTKAEGIEFDIWFDKHYYHRERYGDDNGKREGISHDLVQQLIIDAAKHLLFYSIKVKGFSFVNFELAIRKTRITITQNLKEETKLNIVAEYHYLNLNRYEVTVITALRKDDFHFSDGEYQIEIHIDGTSSLFKMERHNIKMADQYLK